MRISYWSSDVCSSYLCADRDPTNLRRFLVSEAARADEDQRLALRLGQVQQRALHVAQFDVPVLARGCREDAVGDEVVPLALEARAAHLREIEVAQDVE